MSFIHALIGSVSNAGGVPTGGTSYFFGSGSVSGWGRGDNIDKMPSATETVTTLSSVIALGRYQATGNGNSGVAAYCVAGDKSAGNTNKVEKISYTSDSVSTMGNNLPGYYYGGGQGTNQGSKAYYMGGNKYPITATVYGMPFSTETWASLSNDLTYNPLTFSSCSDNGTACYAAGTYTGDTDNVDKMPFSTETPAALSDTLSTGGGYFNGGYGQYGSKGHVFTQGGYPFYTSYEFDISFTTDAVSDGTWSITGRKYGAACSITDTAGYISGGTSDGSTNWTDTIQKNAFPDMSHSTLSATLSEANLGSTSATDELGVV